MIDLLTIKSACNGLLRSIFTGVRIYGPDTTGALERPSFYTEIVPYGLTAETKNLVRQSIGYKITIMEEVPDEVFQLEAFEQIRSAFGLKLSAGGRKLTVRGADFEYIGEKNDVFQMTLRMSWLDTIAEPDSHEIMRELALETEMKGE